MPARNADEIRASIEQTRQQLGVSIVKLRGEVAELSDWRAQLRRNQQPLLIAAGTAGFVLGGGIGATLGLLFGRRRRS
jgi:hypothetical protein